MCCNYDVEPDRLSATLEQQPNTTKGRLAVWGMNCPNCAARVRNRLIAVNGVVEAQVDYMSGIARVLFNPELVTPPALVEAVVRAGGDGQHEYVAHFLG
jgi:copper chaperone CopZ